MNPALDFWTYLVVTGCLPVAHASAPAALRAVSSLGNRVSRNSAAKADGLSAAKPAGKPPPAGT
ncbi:MAG: hypothetical protein ABSC93_13460, partial [Bryobacteraceae bacterium]